MGHQPVSPLRKHLFWILLIKMIVLYGLWLVFIKPNKVHLNQDNLDCLYGNSSAEHCAHPISNQPLQEKKHD